MSDFEYAFYGRLWVRKPCMEGCYILLRFFFFFFRNATLFHMFASKSYLKMDVLLPKTGAQKDLFSGGFTTTYKRGYSSEQNDL